MTGDFELAAAIVAGNRRAVKTFERRFRDRVEDAYRHIGEGRRGGIGLDSYLSAAAVAAATSLLESLPAEEGEALLDEHVRRVLRRRDFALVVAVVEGRAEARAAFRERHESYLRSLLVRSGIADREIERTLAELLRELEGRGMPGASPLRDYQGRCELKDWLFGYVRAVFRGGLGALAPGRSSTPMPPKTAPPDAELEGVLLEVFAERWAALEGRDAAILRRLAFGGRFNRDFREPPQEVLRRHEELVETLHAEVIGLVAQRLGRPLEEVEDAAEELLLGDVERRLEPVCGGHLPREEGSA